MRKETSPLEHMINLLVSVEKSNRIVAEEIEKIPGVEEYMIDFIYENARVAERIYNELGAFSGIAPDLTDY
jgi:hypothetical protein